MKQELERLSASWEDFSSQNTHTNKQQLEKIVHDSQHSAELRPREARVGLYFRL